jgi:hypothetical protein
MRNATLAILGILALAAAPAQARVGAERAGEVKLAQALEGRVAGEPVNCINLRNIRSTRIIDRTAIIYEAAGGTLYVNRPDAGQESLSNWDVLVTRTHSPQLCSIDVVDLYDGGVRMPRGVVFLGEFVPYEKARHPR